MAFPSLSPYVVLARPHQYLKNLFIAAPLFFGHQANQGEKWLVVLLAFAAFSQLASAVYVFNDLLDIDADRIHPEKRRRPLASGNVSPAAARLLIALLLAGSLALVLLMASSAFSLILLAYLALNVGYSVKLKHVPIVDINVIAIGFVLRIFAGGVIVDIWPSQWLVMITYLLALFLALSKRRDDLLLGGEGASLRRSLDGYNLEFVTQSMTIMASVIIVCYTLYTLSPEVESKHHSETLYLTCIWVVVGLMRYLQISVVEQKSGSPTKVLLGDGFLQGVILLWIASFTLAIYVYGG